MNLDDVLVILLAGGAGERLSPLTRQRAKPAVYFGGPYRIIDFTLSNCVNSRLRHIFIATQYKSLSLNRHIRMGWNVVSEELGEFIEILPPQKQVGEHWYPGTADAVYQNLYSLVREAPSRVHSFCEIEQAILMPGVRVGRHARIRRAIIDRDVLIPRGALIGFDAEEDRRRHTVTEGGIVVVTAEDDSLVASIGEDALRVEAESDRGSQAHT